MKIFDWNEYAFKNKKEIKELNSIFIAAPREISKKRFIQIVKNNLNKGNILLGIAKEEFIEGFEGQEHFKTLEIKEVEEVIKKIDKSNAKNKVFILKYFQRDLSNIIQKLSFQKILLVNGSWKKMFHTRAEFYEIIKKNIKFEYISPFMDELEAKEYAKNIKPNFKINKVIKYSEKELMEIVSKVAKNSFATDWQIGAVLAKSGKIILTSHNKVIPFETFAMHYGSVKEKNFSPPNDLNYFDTNHAEVEILVKSLNNNLDLKDTTLYINVLPCPTCTRMLCSIKIKEVVYEQDHSEGYACIMLEKAGIKIRRLI